MPLPQAPLVVISRPIPAVATQLIEQGGAQVQVLNKPTQAQLIDACQQAHGLISLLEDQLDQHFLKACAHLKGISNFAVGHDNIDVKAATALGIPVGNTPGVLTQATADLAFALMLAVARKLVPAYKNVVQGQWTDWEPLGFLGQDLHGKTLGIVGMGRIGQAMAQRCVGAFNMKVCYTAQKPKNSHELPVPAQWVSFEELLTQADVISIHVPLNAQTQNLFNSKAFALTKPNAILMNTARGGIVNQQHLVHALQHGQLWGAGLDVTQPEPLPANHTLLQLPNVLVTPHIGSATQKSRNAMATLAAQNILAALHNKPMPAPLNTI